MPPNYPSYDEIYSNIPLDNLKGYGEYILLSAVFWQSLYWITGIISLQCSAIFQKMDAKKRGNWNMHVVSLLHAVLMSSLAVPILLTKELINNPILGYTDFSQAAYTITTGYFIWDFLISLAHYDLSGPAFVFHGFMATCASVCLFKPVFQYYGGIFLLFELSTIFLNLHWFFDKFGLTGTNIQLANGLLLLFTFFSVRIVFGTYQIYSFFSYCISHWDILPVGYFYLYAFTMLTMQPLNYFWFYQMIKAIAKRFVPRKEKEE
ncbi:hypothetical protein HDV06_006518 [Boothiomyces sp. JEL0866]|nr:hypothetical protein HDV06_006518 [Boothiomyces sp. JEL0866]